MYQREIDVRPNRRSSRRRRRRRRSGGTLLLAALLLAGGCLLAFRMKGAEAEAEGRPSQVSASLPVQPAGEGGEADPAAPVDVDTVTPEEPAIPEGPAASTEPAGEPETREPVGEPEPEAVEPPVSQPLDVPEGPETDLPAEPEEDDGWRLLLVNPWNFMPEGYEVTLRSLGGGHAVDERCYDDLQAMLSACEAEGLSPVICSSYRTQEKQESLFANKIQRLINQGYSTEEAEVEAAKVVAVPGTSEHQLGLALDIVDAGHQVLDESQEQTAVQQWLMAHSWEYGFILRYPNDKSDITGIIYEPWHYRYVGREAAGEIYTQGVCLEEYLDRVHEA